MGCCCCCVCADCSADLTADKNLCVMRHPETNGPRRGPRVTTCIVRRELHCAFCTPHSVIRSLNTTVCVIRTEIRPVVAFPFSMGIGHYHSREFGNEKSRESRAPGNNNPSHNSLTICQVLGPQDLQVAVHHKL